MRESSEPPASIRSLAEISDHAGTLQESGPTSEEPSASFDGEDFLFHLYRGSELLQDNCVGEAKEELERALSLQPRDVEGQGLLGVVYFRLGLYPRAIQIYEELVKSCPGEITPRVNLGLCYLKTGQYTRAREVLDEITRRVPDHRRAWGYLGLVYERIAEYDRARECFVQAAQEHLVERMDRLLASEPGAQSVAPERQALRAAAADAIQELEGDQRPFSRVPPADADDLLLRQGRWHAVEPGGSRLPPPSRRLGRAEPLAGSVAARLGLGTAELPAALDARSGEQARSGGLVKLRVGGALVVRPDFVRALQPDEAPFAHRQIPRRSLGRELPEPLGGARHPLSLIEGQGHVFVKAGGDFELVTIALAGELFYIREDRLAGFDYSLSYECGRLPTSERDHEPMVQLSGEGALTFVASRGVTGAHISSAAPTIVRASDVIGWTGRLLPHPLPNDASPLPAARWIRLTGEGFVLLDAV